MFALDKVPHSHISDMVVSSIYLGSVIKEINSDAVRRPQPTPLPVTEPSIRHRLSAACSRPRCRSRSRAPVIGCRMEKLPEYTSGNGRLVPDPGPHRAPRPRLLRCTNPILCRTVSCLGAPTRSPSTGLSAAEVHQPDPPLSDCQLLRCTNLIPLYRTASC